jgi:hypothetical protein
VSRWYRAYEGTVTDAKLGEAALIAGVSRSVSIAAWHCLLESAAAKNNCGSYETSARRVAVILCEPLAQIEALFAAFGELGMISAGAVASWKRRQFQSDDSKERVAKHRASKRPVTAKKEAGNVGVTACNGDVTLPETETETETEVSEPKGSSPRPWALPIGVSLQVWQDLKTIRKRKRLPNTDTAWKQFCDDLARVSLQTGIPPPELIRRCVAKGWGAIYDPRENRNERAGSANPLGTAVANILGQH